MVNDSSSVSIFVSGDFCPIGDAEELIINGEYGLLYNDIISDIKAADYAITNLECPLTVSSEKQNKYGPCLKATPKAAEAIAYAGFDLVTLANNHIMDYQDVGLKSTIQALEDSHIEYVGAGSNLSQARTIKNIQIKDKRIAILNFAENEFSNTTGDFAGANPLDLANNYEDIVKAKQNNDVVIVVYHGGNENYNLPSPRLKKVLRFYASAGANAVIAHHTHCFSGYEVYKSTPIFYSIGNFLFDYNQKSNKKWTTSYAVKLIIGDSISFEIIPYRQFDKNIGISKLQAEDLKLIKEEIKNLNSIIQDDSLLEEHFNKFSDSLKPQFFHSLQPTTNRVLHKLMKLGLLPSMSFGKRKNLHLNLLRCEAHRDVLLKIISDDSNT